MLGRIPMGDQRVIAIDQGVRIQFWSGFGKRWFRGRWHGGNMVLKNVRSFDARREHDSIQKDTDAAHQPDFSLAGKVLGPKSRRALKLGRLKTGGNLVKDVLHGGHQPKTPSSKRLRGGYQILASTFRSMFLSVGTRPNIPWRLSFRLFA
jgi:hypothetical protein